MYNSDSKLRGKIKMILLTPNEFLCFYIATVAGKDTLNTATNTTGPYNTITPIAEKPAAPEFTSVNKKSTLH